MGSLTPEAELRFHQELRDGQSDRLLARIQGWHYPLRESQNDQREIPVLVPRPQSNLDPLTVYLAYSLRWQIEVIFNHYKNIIDRDTFNVHTDYRVYATELINFLSVVISTRIKNEIVKKELNKRYSYKQIIKMLSKYKKVRLEENGEWKQVTMLKYIEELTALLGV